MKFLYSKVIKQNSWKQYHDVREGCDRGFPLRPKNTEQTLFWLKTGCFSARLFMSISYFCLPFFLLKARFIVENMRLQVPSWVLDNIPPGGATGRSQSNTALTSSMLLSTQYPFPCKISSPAGREQCLAIGFVEIRSLCPSVLHFLTTVPQNVDWMLNILTVLPFFAKRYLEEWLFEIFSMEKFCKLKWSVYKNKWGIISASFLPTCNIELHS